MRISSTVDNLRGFKVGKGVLKIMTQRGGYTNYDLHQQTERVFYIPQSKIWSIKIILSLYGYKIMEHAAVGSHSTKQVCPTPNLKSAHVPICNQLYFIAIGYIQPEKATKLLLKWAVYGSKKCEQRQKSTCYTTRPGRLGYLRRGRYGFDAHHVVF